MAFLNNKNRDFACLPFALAHLFINGYYFKSEPYRLFTLIKVFTYENLYQGDMIRMFHIKSFLIPFLSIFERIGCLELVVFIFYLICLVAFYAISMRMFRLIFNQSNYQYLFASFLLFSKPVLGGIEIFAPSFTYSTVGTPLALYALYLLFQANYFRSAIILGILFNVHLLSAIPVYIFFFIMVVFNWEDKGREALKGFVLSLALTLPLVVWMFSETVPFTQSVFIDPQWLNLIKARSAHHFFPFYSLYHFDGIIYAVLAFLIMVNTKFNNSNLKKIYLIMVCSVSLCVFNFLMIHGKPVTIIFLLQLYRTAFFLVYFGLMLYAHHLSILFRSLKNVEKVLMLVASTALFLNEIFIFILMLLIWLLYQLLKAGLSKSLRQSFMIRTFTAIFFILIMLIGMQKTDKSYFSNLLNQKLKGEIDFPGMDTRDSGFDPEWANIKLWVKGNTNEDARFIIPPYLKNFRVHAERAIVANWKDGTFGIYDRTFAKEWAERMAELKCIDKNAEFGGWQIPSACYNSQRLLTDQDFKRLAHKHKANYLIVENDISLDFTKVYHNNRFQIYRF